jgi:hypothetical protein
VELGDRLLLWAALTVERAEVFDLVVVGGVLGTASFSNAPSTVTAPPTNGAPRNRREAATELATDFRGARGYSTGAGRVVKWTVKSDSLCDIVTSEQVW